MTKKKFGIFAVPGRDARPVPGQLRDRDAIRIFVPGQSRDRDTDRNIVPGQSRDRATFENSVPGQKRDRDACPVPFPFPAPGDRNDVTDEQGDELRKGFSCKPMLKNMVLQTLYFTVAPTPC